MPDTRERSFQVERWIDPSKFGWWSGDQHIHAAGCAHYCDPTQGVLPADMEHQYRGRGPEGGVGARRGGPASTTRSSFSAAPTIRPPAIRISFTTISRCPASGPTVRATSACSASTDQIYPGANSDRHWPTFCLKPCAGRRRQGAIDGHGRIPAGACSPPMPATTTVAGQHQLGPMIASCQTDAAQLRHPALQRHRGERIRRRCDPCRAGSRRQACAR